MVLQLLLRSELILVNFEEIIIQLLFDITNETYKIFRNRTQLEWKC